MENNLPQGWVETTISEYAIISKSKGDEGKAPYLEIGDIDIASKKYQLKEKPSVKGCKTSQKNDILISRVRPTRGAITIINEEELLVSSAFSVLRFNEEVEAKSVYFQLAFNSTFLNYLGDNCTGTMYPTVSEEIIENFKLNLPPLAEQHRIVAKLDALFEKVESNKQRLEKIPKILNRFRQSVLAAAVSGKLTEDWRGNSEYDTETDLPLSWHLVKIDKLVNSTKTDLRTGPFGTALKKSEHQPIGIPVWGIESIGENGSFTGYNKIFVTKEKAKELKSFEVKGGNIIISRSGTVGEICILPNDVQYGLISTNLMKIVLNNEIIISKYFCWLFDGSQNVIDKLRELCTGSTRLFLTQTILKEIDYPLPPFDEQKEIVRRVEQLFSFADKLEARYTKAKTMLDKLPQSILAKAFRGELVAQDPNDEPASVLLERIKKEKEKLVAEKKGKKSKEYSIEEKPLKIAAEGKVKYKKAKV